MSNNDFAADRRPSYLVNDYQGTPPNTFQARGTAQDTTAKSSIAMVSAATVGVLNNTFQASIPLGYIRITNPQGYQGPAQVPTTDNIYNNQLISGIYLGAGGNGSPMAFSTNLGILQQWVAFNNQPPPSGPSPGGSSAPAAPRLTQPPLTDNTGTPYVYLADGTPVTSAAQLKNLTQIGSPQTGCFADMIGNGTNCDKMLSGFANAYDTGAPQTQPGNSAELTSIEEWKEEVIQAYGVAWPQWNALSQQGMSVQQANVQAFVPAPSTVAPYPGAPGPPYYTGMQLFNPQGQDYIAMPVKFTTSGTPMQYLTQITEPITDSQSGQTVNLGTGPVPVVVATRQGPDSGIQNQVNALLQKLYQRCREIKPSATYTEMTNALNMQTMDLGSVAYLYMDPNSGQLVCKETPPPWTFTNGQQPDGNVTEVDSQSYDTIPVIANPVHELDVPDSVNDFETLFMAA